MGLELRAVQTDEDWAAMHDIRRKVLFTPERQAPEYNDNHPDDHAEGHVPHLLMLDETPIGCARLDLHGDLAVLRLVAVLPAYQRDGNGRLMEQMMTEKAWELGARQFRVNAARDAVGFYEKCGWREESWDPEDIGMSGRCVQMVKDLG